MEIEGKLSDTTGLVTKMISVQKVQGLKLKYQKFINIVKKLN